MYMKVTIICRNPKSWYYNELKRACSKLGINSEIVDISSVNELENLTQQMGEIIIWRSVSLKDNFNIAIAKELLSLYSSENKAILINDLALHPLIRSKLYQQKLIAQRLTPDFQAIPTYHFTNNDELIEHIQKGILKYPFIQKPIFGSKGKGIKLINNQEELQHALSGVDITKVIYQNFIPQEGDYRALVLGGRLIGLIYRKRTTSSFLNNVNQGAVPIRITDPQTIEKVGKIALHIASIMNLRFVGVDIIQDSTTGIMYVLEANSIPGWKGFQNEYPEINVAEEIIKYALEMYNRNKQQTTQIVKNYYDQNYQYLPLAKKFHYASRMYLWTRQGKYYEILQELKYPIIERIDEYIANSTNSHHYLNNVNKNINIEESAVSDQSIIKTMKKAREPFYKKYPQIKLFNKLLFQYLICKTIYNADLKEKISTVLSQNQLLNLYENLRQDKEAILVLSTLAINYFYLLENYLDQKITEPLRYLEISQEFENRTLNNIPPRTLKRLNLYMLTHTVIGESRFYARNVRDPVYNNILSFTEKIITQNYFEIPLDNKFEFLVCCRLTDYSTNLEEIIYNEADNSLSEIGNFIEYSYKVSFNKKHKTSSLISSEHRSVLYLMSRMPKNIPL